MKIQYNYTGLLQFGQIIDKPSNLVLFIGALHLLHFSTLDNILVILEY